MKKFLIGIATSILVVAGANLIPARATVQNFGNSYGYITVDRHWNVNTNSYNYDTITAHRLTSQFFCGKIYTSATDLTADVVCEYAMTATLPKVESQVHSFQLCHGGSNGLASCTTRQKFPWTVPGA